MSNCSATARRAERAAEPALIDLAYAQAAAAGRHQRAVLRAPRGLRGARRADLHRRRPPGRRDRPAPAHAGAPLQDPRRDGGAVRRSAGGARLDASRSRERCAFRPRTQKPILPRFSVGDGERGRRGRRAAQARRGRARRSGSPAHGLAPGRTDRGIPRAARLRARRHRGHEISRLFPDRRRLHPMGEGAGHSGRARAAARAPARWSPMRSPSPTSIRSASGCCSSASSIPSACRCRTSTSTSARTAATR